MNEKVASRQKKTKKGWIIGMSSGFRTEVRRYWIYCILDEITETVFVGKSYAKRPKTQYYSHMREEHSLTKDAYSIAYLTNPDFVILECVYCTGRIAFKHVLAWYIYFEEQGYTILTDEKAGSMVDNPNFETQQIYDRFCAPYTLQEVLTRKVKEPWTEQEEMKENKQEDTGEEALQQMNIRVKESVARSFRSFCKERDLTQSEGLRLLLLSEAFADRDVVMQSYQQEFDALRTENSKLKEENIKLLTLQRDKESWALRHRKEWIHIAKAIVSCMVERAYIPYFPFELHKTIHRFKSNEGYELFSSHYYPQEGGCFEVIVSGLVYGLGRVNNNPERNVPLFVCGKLKDKTPLKFRWYPRKDFIGVPPSDKNISYEGKWMLGCAIAKDGAADLVCAVPLCWLDRAEAAMLDIDSDLNLDNTIPAERDQGIKPSLESMITAANKKQN